MGACQEDNRPGTIGRALPRTEIQIRDEAGLALAPGQIGLIWIRGPQVMAGYYRNPERTAQVMDAAGWFNSGDLGCIEPDGHLRITGRAKDTIVLVGGENVEPEPIEVALKASPLIDQAVVVGQDQKHVGALVVVNPTALELRVPQSQWQVRDGLIGAPAVLDLYRQEIDRLVSRAAGFRPADTEGALLGLLGSMVGLLIFFAVYGAITAANPTYVPPGSSNPVPLRVDLVWPGLVRSVLSLAVLALLAAYVPARRSAKMTIVDALGHI